MSFLLVGLIDGTEIRGEYVGAGEGYMYLSNEAGVHRVKQAEIMLLASAPDSEAFGE